MARLGFLLRIALAASVVVAISQSDCAAQIRILYPPAGTAYGPHQNVSTFGDNSTPNEPVLVVIFDPNDPANVGQVYPPNVIQSAAVLAGPTGSWAATLNPPGPDGWPPAATRVLRAIDTFTNPTIFRDVGIHFPRPL